jgi:hypothetical protein
MDKLQDVAILHTDRIVWTDALPPASYPNFTCPAPYHRDEAKDVIYGGLQIIFSSFMSKTSLVREVGFHPDMRGVDDMYLFYRLSQLGQIIRIPLPLTYYYAHAANLSHTSNLFVRGFYQVYEALKADGMPLVVQHSALAQALRTEAVSLLAINRQKAFELLLRSIRTYFISSTLTRLAFLVVTWPIPLKIQSRLMIFVKKIKFMFPTLKDLLRP